MSLKILVFKTYKGGKVGGENKLGVMSTSCSTKSSLFPYPLTYNESDIHNWKKEKPLCTGHLRDPSICAPESEWIEPWGKRQNKGSGGRADDGGDGDGRGGGCWSCSEPT